MTGSSGPVVVVGDVMIDVVAVVEGELARGSDTAARVRWGGGGAAANTASWLARLGADVVLCCRVGDDAAGADAVASLRALGVDVRAVVDPAAPTGPCVVVVTGVGERTMLPDRGANLGLSVADLPACDAAAHVHVSGYVLLSSSCRDAGLAALARARAAGVPTSVDPASAAPILACGAEAVRGWVRGVDVLLPNLHEAQVLTGLSGPREAALALAADVGEVVVKLGADGALWTDGSTVVVEPAPAVEVVDTTGAGDAFAAGFLHARLAGDGGGSREALRAGCAAGARVCAQVGARPGA